MASGSDCEGASVPRGTVRYAMSEFFKIIELEDVIVPRETFRGRALGMAP
jgi:hypothetical protein